MLPNDSGLERLRGAGAERDLDGPHDELALPLAERRLDEAGDPLADGRG